MKDLQVREVPHREYLKEQELSVAPHVLSLARASNQAPRISSAESYSIHLESQMPLLTRARRVSQGHRCRYVFSRCLRTPEDTKGKEVSNASSSQTRCERTESRRVLTFCTGTTYFLRYRQIEEPDTPSRRAAAAWVRWLTLSTISLERESAKDFFLVQSDRRLLPCKVICPPERSFAWEAGVLGPTSCRLRRT